MRHADFNTGNVNSQCEQREPCVRATNPVFTVSYNGFVNGEGTNVSPARRC